MTTRRAANVDAHPHRRAARPAVKIESLDASKSLRPLHEVNMHKSRLGNIVIDCQEDDLDRATTFWAAALGGVARTLSDPTDSNYRGVNSPSSEIGFLVQKVDHPSRLHLDIETNDIEAEVRRLEALGATRVAWVKRWWVMQAPTGHRFCVVRPQTRDFDERATVWP